MRYGAMGLAAGWGSHSQRHASHVTYPLVDKVPPPYGHGAMGCGLWGLILIPVHFTTSKKVPYEAMVSQPLILLARYHLNIKE